MVDFHITAGAAMVVLSSTCLILNATVLVTILKKPEFYKLTAYKFMLLMGLCDVAQGFVHHVTGWFTIFRWEASYWTYQILATLISPGYETYIFTTILLAFHRFILICTSYEHRLFGRAGTWLWCLLVLAIFASYTGVQLSGKVYTYYKVTEYKWDYDYSLPWTAARTQFVLYFQIVGVLFAWVLYVVIACALFKKRHEAGAATCNKANRVILVQAFVITVYCTLQNFLWHKIDLFVAQSYIVNFALNMMWIGNSGLCPCLCLIVNRKLRREVFMNLSKRVSTTGWI